MELNGAVQVTWQSDRDLRCFMEGCERPVKHRVISPAGDVHACHRCFKAADWTGFCHDHAERSPLDVYWPKA